MVWSAPLIAKWLLTASQYVFQSEACSLSGRLRRFDWGSERDCVRKTATTQVVYQTNRWLAMAGPPDGVRPSATPGRGWQ